MLVRPTQDWNARVLIVKKPALVGRVSPVRLVQPLNASTPILVTELGIVRVPVRPEQLENALSLIVVNPPPRVSPVRPEH